MQSVSRDNFGLLIAYVIPGLVVVWGVSYFSTTVAGWLGAVPEGQPTVGGFLYVTIASIAAGMLVSAARWFLIDSLHHRTGIQPPMWDFGDLGSNSVMFLTVVEHQYRYYQFYSGLMLSVPFLFIIRWLVAPVSSIQIVAEGMLLLAMEALCFSSSRDTLRKYYARVTQLHRTGSQVAERKMPDTVIPIQSTGAGPRP